jgi:hypothetical protein
VTNWWLAAGSPNHWQIAFAFGKIWGLRAINKMIAKWEKLLEGDRILFYATKPVGGVVGYGIIRTKFKQDKPLWPREVKEGKVIWPYRFEFDVEYCLPQDKWMTHKVSSNYIRTAARGGFQIVKEEKAKEVLQLLPFKSIQPTVTKEKRASTHEEIKERLVLLGKLQSLIAESEYDMDGMQLDVVWRRVEKAVPAYVFEVQIGGDLYHAIGKLKHAHDLWNSNIFLVITEKDTVKAQELLSGTFHEIKGKIRILNVEEINELYKRKKAYRDYESQLGLL